MTDKLAAIIRVLGNELPPRDLSGSRIAVLRRILTEEPAFPDVVKWFYINRPFDLQYRRELCEVLDQHNAHYITIGFDRTILPASRENLLRYGIAVNSARNDAITAGLAVAKFAMILDGDCMFTSDGWAPVAEAMRANMHHYLSVPHRRESSSEQGEPMLAFGRDSFMRFDASVCFGDGDKLKLLFWLGHSTDDASRHLPIEGNLTKLVGEVLHLATGDDATEADAATREHLRELSLQRFERKIAEYPRLHLSSRGGNVDYWQQVDGFFDFAGPYSGFAHDAEDNSHFVEVGSWLGRSTIYLASQLRGRGHRAKIDAVDTWNGGSDPVLSQRVASMGGPENLFQSFLRNVADAGYADLIYPVRLASTEAATAYADNSIDVVYLDAGHSYSEVLADLHAWYPKVKPNGIIAGHDFVFDNPVSRDGVVRAVCEFFEDKPLEIMPQARTWKSVKYADGPPHLRRRRWA